MASSPPSSSHSSTHSLISINMRHKLNRRGYRLMELLGHGTYSEVRKAWCPDRNCAVAIKIVDRRKAKRDFLRNFLPRELQLLANLHHPHIVKMNEVIEEGPKICIVEELAEHGDLLRRIKRNTRLPEDQAKLIFRQIVEALRYLQKRKIVHRDLKCENILIDRNENIRLADFGFARHMMPEDISRSFCGSRLYAAPEILRGKSYFGFGVDIWSAGVVLYICLTGLMPYNDRQLREMIQKQMNHQISYHRSVQSLISDEAKDLIYSLLQPISEQRPSPDEIVSSAWLRNTPWLYNNDRRIYEVIRRPSSLPIRQQQSQQKDQHQPFGFRHQQVPQRDQHQPFGFRHQQVPQRDQHQPFGFRHQQVPQRDQHQPFGFRHQQVPQRDQHQPFGFRHQQVPQRDHQPQSDSDTSSSSSD